MRLDDAPAPTGAMYHARQPGTQEALNIDVSSLQRFPEALTPNQGDCLYASIHRQYFLFKTHFPQSFAVMQQRLRTFCGENNLDEPVQTPLPPEDEADDDPTQAEADQLVRWRKIVAKQLELHWDWYDVPPGQDENPNDTQRYELDGHLDWLLHPQLHPNYRGDDLLRNQARQALQAQPGGVPHANTTVLADRMRVVLTMTKIPTMWALGYEADAIADVLGIFIHTWLHTASDGNFEYATRSRAHGPRGDEAAALATAYGSGGYIPRFNLLRTMAHFSYQKIDRMRGVENNRQRVQEIAFANGDPATAYPGDPNEAGELNPSMVGGVLQPGRSRQAANNGAGGSGDPPMGDGGDGGGNDPNPDCGNANACFQGGRRWNTRIPGRVQIRKVDPDEWELDGDMITEAEVQYIKDRLARAHDAFFEHWASRANYGKIMLMTDPYRTEVVDGKKVVRKTDEPKPKQSGRAAGAQSSHGTNAKNKKVAQAFALDNIDWEYMEDVDAYTNDLENNDEKAQKNTHNAFKKGLQHVKWIFTNLGLSSDPHHKMFLRALARWWRAQCELQGWAPWNNEEGPYQPHHTYKPRTINLKGTKGEGFKFQGTPYKYAYNHQTKLPKGAKAADKLKLKQVIVDIVAAHFTEADGNSDQKRKEAAMEFAQWLDMLVYVVGQVAGVDLSAPAPDDEPAITKDVLMARRPPGAGPP